MDPGRLRPVGEGGRWLAAAGVATVADLLARAACVRDLPDRSNHRLEAAGRVVHVKRTKPRRWRALPALPPGFRAAAIVRGLGLPVAETLFTGRDPALGLVHGTADLAPARPLDDLLREGALDAAARRRVATRLARLVARLHAAGLHHRDLYLNHVWVDLARPDPVVALLDLDRLGAHRWRLSRWVVKDLAALEASAPEGTVSPRERLRFLLAWLRERGLPPRPHARRLLCRVAAKAARIRRHVPRTPVGAAARPRAGVGP
jgi:Lipopolysaccharide kinase (Kdo/WaaP) family